MHAFISAARTGAQDGRWAPYLPIVLSDQRSVAIDTGDATGAVAFYVAVSSASRGRGTQVDPE